MKLIDRDKLKRHLDYLIQKEKEFANKCDTYPYSEFQRQRKYCFEANALAYELCENVMDYYLVSDTQPVNQWISVKDRLPDALYDCLVWYSCDTAFGKCKSWGITHCSRCDWYTKHLDGDNIVVLYWMPCPEPPKDGEHND